MNFVMVLDENKIEHALSIDGWRYLEKEQILLLYHQGKQIGELHGMQAVSARKGLVSDTVRPLPNLEPEEIGWSPF